MSVGATGRKYVRSPERHHALLLPRLRELLGQVPQSARLLDLGCGAGHLTVQFAALGFSAVDVDVSATGVEIAKQSCPACEFHVREFNGLAPEEFGGPFDVVTSIEVIEHLYSPMDFLRVCHRMLRQDGTLLVSTPYHGFAKNLGLALLNRWESHLQPLNEGGHIKFWSRRTLTHALETTGLNDD